MIGLRQRNKVHDEVLSKSILNALPDMRRGLLGLIPVELADNLLLLQKDELDSIKVRLDIDIDQICRVLSLV